MEFRIEYRDGDSRVGHLRCGERRIHTPAFLPVATLGAVKGITPDMLRDSGVEGLLVNTYHLLHRPGLEVIEKAGGIHKFMNWDGLIISDSGGYQITSLSGLVEVSDGYVKFRSPLDGSERLVTPDMVVEWQEIVGADIIMVLDECRPYPLDREDAAVAVERTVRWAERSKQAHRTDQALFAITQGSVYEDLRMRCVDALIRLDFDGYAIGGLSVGEPKELTHRMVESDCSALPYEKPRYLMGVGSLYEIYRAVMAGVDLFDSALPSRNGRNGQLFTSSGRLRILASRFRYDFTPPDRNCDCYLCRNFSRAYLRHLFVCSDMLGPVLATLHNLRFLQQRMERIREAIADARLAELASDMTS